MTSIVSKQLLPVYDKPMIYYPLSTLMLGGIRSVAIISTPSALPLYEELLGNGSRFGIEIEYFVQTEPRGLADAFIICKDFIKGECTSLILGDNIFYGKMDFENIFSSIDNGARIFGYPVKDPERYGVIEFDSKNNVKNIIEKPVNPPSKYAVPGLYIYDRNVTKYAESLKPSSRGEIEITDLNNIYLSKDKLECHLFSRGVAWLDAGTALSLNESSNFVMAIEQRQTYKIACLEEIALRRNFITSSKFKSIVSDIPDSQYKEYLESIFDS